MPDSGGSCAMQLVSALTLRRGARFGSLRLPGIHAVPSTKPRVEKDVPPVGEVSKEEAGGWLGRGSLGHCPGRL